MLSHLTFFKMAAGTNFGTTHKEYLVVFITVQNLVGMASVVLIIEKFEYFARLV